MKKIVLIFWLTLLLFAGNLGAQSKVNSVSMPDLVLQNLEGREISTKSFVDTKNPVVLDFWATWCKPCIVKYNTMKDVIKNWEKETGVKLYIVSIDSKKETEKIKKLVAQYGWPFEVLLDPEQKLFSSLNGGNKSVPQSFFFNPAGQLKFTSTGSSISKVGTENEDILKDLYGDKKADLSDFKADLAEYFNYIKKSAK